MPRTSRTGSGRRTAPGLGAGAGAVVLLESALGARTRSGPLPTLTQANMRAHNNLSPISNSGGGTRVNRGPIMPAPYHSHAQISPSRAQPPDIPGLLQEGSASTLRLFGRVSASGLRSDAEGRASSSSGLRLDSRGAPDASNAREAAAAADAADSDAGSGRRTFGQRALSSKSSLKKAPRQSLSRVRFVSAAEELVEGMGRAEGDGARQEGKRRGSSPGEGEEAPADP